MADKTPSRPSLISSFAALGRSVVDLFQAANRIWSRDEVPHSKSEEPPAQFALPVPDQRPENAQLLFQRTPGWNTPSPSRLAAPSYAPAMTSFGIVSIALGAVTKWPLSLIGAVIFVLAIAKWIGELLHD